MKIIVKLQKEKRPSLAPGQVWKHTRTGEMFISAKGNQLFNINHDLKYTYAANAGFSGADEIFEYVGMASSIVVEVVQ